MKTKIIYISGGEIFNTADIRAALDAVRDQLGLTKDVVLFGVPVDAEDALYGQFNAEQPSQPNNNCIAVDEQSSIDKITEVEPEIKETKKAKRSKKLVVNDGDSDVHDTNPEPVVESIAPVNSCIQDEEKIIPILSVLGGDTKNITEPADDTETNDDTETSDEITDNSVDIELVKIDEKSDFVIDVNEDILDEEIDITAENEKTDVDIADDDDNQLEKLLQSVQSLHEDKEEVPDLTVVDNSLDETDVTLEKLANEFAENQDKIVNTTKSSARGGRIGKLKNILPFKKAKHNDSSLMGDLFGWAGVAANDEEFAIPEFFPTAMKNKA